MLAQKHYLSLKTLDILENSLAGEEYTITEMTVFAYALLAKDAELPTDEFANFNVWIERFRDQDGFLDEVYPYSIDPNSSRELRGISPTNLMKTLLRTAHWCIRRE